MLIIGHRGAKGLAPENTTASFDAAIAHGVDMIELDVRVSGDKIPIIIHDPTLHGFRVDKTPFKKLQEMQPTLLTLESGLLYIPDSMPLRIEVKPVGSLAEIVACIQKHLANSPKRAMIEISSFSPHVLRDVKRQLPGMPLVLNEKWSGVRASWRAKRLDVTSVCMQQRWLWKGFIRSFSKRYRLCTYVLDDAKRAKSWSEAGLYAVITDLPNNYRK